MMDIDDYSLIALLPPESLLFVAQLAEVLNNQSADEGHQDLPLFIGEHVGAFSQYQALWTDIRALILRDKQDHKGRQARASGAR